MLRTIPHGINAGVGGLHLVIDLDATPYLQPRLQGQLGTRLDTRRQHNGVAFDDLPALGSYSGHRVRAEDFLGAVQNHLDAECTQVVKQDGARSLIELLFHETFILEDADGGAVTL
jgi:hypothetical protein